MRHYSHVPLPKLLDNNTFTPTAVPPAKAIIKFCKGKAKETAVKAFSLI